MFFAACLNQFLFILSFALIVKIILSTTGRSYLGTFHSSWIRSLISISVGLSSLPLSFRWKDSGWRFRRFLVTSQIKCDILTNHLWGHPRLFFRSVLSSRPSLYERYIKGCPFLLRLHRHSATVRTSSCYMLSKASSLPSWQPSSFQRSFRSSGFDTAFWKCNPFLVDLFGSLLRIQKYASCSSLSKPVDMKVKATPSHPLHITPWIMARSAILQHVWDHRDDHEGPPNESQFMNSQMNKLAKFIARTGLEIKARLLPATVQLMTDQLSLRKMECITFCMTFFPHWTTSFSCV